MIVYTFYHVSSLEAQLLCIIKVFIRPSTSRGTKCLKNHSCDVIKIREMRVEVGKKTLKNGWQNLSFLWRHVTDFLRHFVPLSPQGWEITLD